jgi:hypothetical protein
VEGQAGRSCNQEGRVRRRLTAFRVGGGKRPPPFPPVLLSPKYPCLEKFKVQSQEHGQPELVIIMPSCGQ